MKAWQRALVWLLMFVIAAVILPGADPYRPLLLGVLFIVAFEVVQRKLSKRRKGREVREQLGNSSGH